MAEDTKPTQAAAAPAAPVVNEIATIERDVNRLFFGQVLFNNDDTLLSRGQGKGLKIYDELRRDAHAAAVLDKRELAVVARPWDITPASESADDKAAAEMVRANIKTLQFDRISRELLDATLKGFSVGEVMWGLRENVIVALDVIPRNQRRFVFDLHTRAPRLITRERIVEGEELPERKFIVHTVGGKEGLPYGLGVGSRLFWPVFFKRQDISFWLIFADKFGSPTSLGKYPAGTSIGEQEKLLAALRAIAQDAGIIVPVGTEIELLEATRAGSIDAYEKLARYMDEQMSLAVLGETMTTNAQPAGLGSNQASVHNDVRKELAQADADLLSDTLNATLVKWLVDYNFPGAGYPKLYRNFEEQVDLNARADRDIKIYQLGYEPNDQYIADTYGPGWTQRAIAPPPVIPPGGQDPGANFAESADAQRQANRALQAEFVDAAEKLSSDWRALMRGRVEDLQAMLEETGDLALFRERMDELLDAEPPKELVDALARAGFTAHLAGRAKESSPDVFQPQKKG